MPVTLKNLQNAIEMAEIRLGEVLQAYAVLRAINDAHEPLARSLAKRNGFWRPVSLGLQTTILTGVIALLDKTSPDSATFYGLLDILTATQKSQLPAGMIDELDVIRARYKKYRHKLFGHNDLKRMEVAEQFDQAGFTWASVAEDLTILDWVMKVFEHVLDARHPPSRESSEKLIYSFNLGESQTRRHARALLREVIEPVELDPVDFTDLRASR